MGQPSSKARHLFFKPRRASNSKAHPNARKNSDGDFQVIDRLSVVDDCPVSANGQTSRDQKSTQPWVQSNKESVNSDSAPYPSSPPPPPPPPNISGSITANATHTPISYIPPPPPPPPPPPLGSAPSTPGHDCRRCHHLRDIQRDRAELLTMRTRVDHERNLYSQLRRFNVEARDKLMNAVNSAISNETLLADIVAIQELHRKARILNQELHEKEEQFSELETRLSNLDYNFQKKEEAFYSPAILGEIKQNPLEDATSIATLEPKSSIASSDNSNLPPLLQAYYDRAGDVTIEWDRLQEFEQDHRRKLRTREKMVDTGQLPELPAKFLEGYFAKRAEIVQRYLQAKIDAQGLRLECTKQNYHIEDDGGIDNNEGELDHSMRFRETQLAKENGYLSVRSAGKPLRLVHYWGLDPQERVKGWLTVSLRAQGAEAYQHVPWESQAPWSEADLEKSLEDENDIQGTASVQETTEHLVSTKAQASPQWPGEILLQRRWSDPGVLDDELADTRSMRADVPRSVC